MFNLAKFTIFGSVTIAVIITIVSIWFEELISHDVLVKSYSTLGVLFVGSIIYLILSLAIGFKE
ncbi:MAG: hypothetical protein ACFFG0_08205 [Candidatus Thorarchaeota archaeon]